VPTGVEQPVEIVNVEEPDPLIDPELKLAVAPLGKPLTPRLTVPLNPFRAFTTAL
jgi:hypothetical protein